MNKLLLFFLSVISTGCQEEQKFESASEIAKRFLRNNQNITIVTIKQPDSSLAAAMLGSSSLFRPIASRFQYVDADTLNLNLLEFQKDYQAYGSYQRLCPRPAALATGFFRNRNTVVFIHKNFLGFLWYSGGALIPMRYIEEALGSESIQRSMPGVFESFPINGRISNSERVYFRHPRTDRLDAPLFSASYLCHLDTAWIYRIMGNSHNLPFSQLVSTWMGDVDTLGWGQTLIFKGLNEFSQPTFLIGFEEGLVGVEGCYDSILAFSYAQKTKEMTTLAAKP